MISIFSCFRNFTKKLMETKWIKVRIVSLTGREKSFEKLYICKNPGSCDLDVQILKINLGKFSFCGKEKPLLFEPYPHSFPTCYISISPSLKTDFFAKAYKIKSVWVLITAEEKIMWWRYVCVYFRNTCFTVATVKH